MLLLLGLYAVLALTFTIGKMLLYYMDPLFMIGIRMVISGVVLLFGYYFFTGHKPRMSRKDWFFFFVISVIHIFIPYATEFIAMQTISPASAALMFNFAPFFTALFSFFYFKERMTKTKWLGMLIAFAGLLYFFDITSIDVQSIASFDKAYAFLLFGVAMAALAWVVIKIFIKEHNYSPVFINGIAMLLGGFESFIASYAINESMTFPKEGLAMFLFLFFSIIILANIFYNFYGYLLKTYTATLLAFVGIVTPLITALFDWYFLGITIHMNFIITSILIGIGVYIFYKEELQLGYIVKN